MQRILGIDLGATAVKAVAIESSFRTHTLAGFRAEPVPPDNEAEPKSYAERLKPALEALAQDEWFRADSIICSLPGAHVATHQLTLPFTDRKQIEATLPSEVEDLIPFSLDEIVFDWHVLARSPGKTDVMVAVTPKREVQAVLDALKAVNVDPNVVTFSALALANLFTDKYLAPIPASPETPPACEAVVDIGAERVNVAVVEGGEFRFARSFSPGGAAITKALARALELPFDKAEELKLSLSLNGENDPTMSAVLDRAVGGLLREIRATFSAYAAKTKRKVERVTLCGGGARLSGIDSFLAEALGVEVQPLKLNEATQFPEPADLDQGALALALGLRGVGATSTPRIDFRKDEFAFTKNAGETRSLYVSLAAMAATIVILLGASMWAKLHALENREAKLDDQLCDITKKVLKTCETDYRVAIGKLKGGKSPAASIPTFSAVDVTMALTAGMPPGGDAVLSDVDIVDGTISLRGDAKGYETIDELITNLQAQRCIKEVKDRKRQKTKDGRVEFTLDATYDCNSTRKAGS